MSLFNDVGKLINAVGRNDPRRGELIGMVPVAGGVVADAVETLLYWLW